MGLIAVIGVLAGCVWALVKVRVSRPKAAWIALGYFLLASVMVIGNPFATPQTPAVPIFGFLLTLPWSLIAGQFPRNYRILLELCAAVNAGIVFVCLGRRS